MSLSSFISHFKFLIHFKVSVVTYAVHLMCMSCVYTTVHVWRSEENSGSWLTTICVWIAGIKLSLSLFCAKSFNC